MTRSDSSATTRTPATRPPAANRRPADRRPAAKPNAPGDALALPIVLTWAVAQLGVIVLKLPTVVWIAPALVAAVLSLLVGRRRESVVYLWVAAMFCVLFLLAGEPGEPAVP
jgi:hypothetical protein